jgi:flavin reductase
MTSAHAAPPAARLAGLTATPPDAFRQAMAQITAAVHVITTSGASGRRGLTASAVTSLSDTPAMMLACIHADSQTLAAIEANGAFCINALSGQDQDVAEVFAGRRGLAGEERFSIGTWSNLTTGAPVLTTALVTFDCRLVEARTMATHRIIIGEVVALGGHGLDAAASEGLIYRNRRFGKF